MMICAIIVTFEPNEKHLQKVINTLKNTGIFPIIVDNSEKNKVDIIDIEFKIDMNGNQGIAAAQNCGIRKAIEIGAKYVIFLDQDSNIDKKFLINMIKNVNKGLCVYTPVIFDDETNIEIPSQRITKFGLTKDVFCYKSKGLRKTDIAISSGMFMPIDVFKYIGFFDEDFYIDFVDVEWCIRCYKKNMPIYVVPSAILKHKIGDMYKKIGLITINVHSPKRTYYKVRNSFLLLRKNVNVVFALRQIIPAIIHNFLLTVYGKSKKNYVKYYYKGIVDGIFGETGKYRE